MSGRSNLFVIEQPDGVPIPEVFSWFGVQPGEWCYRKGTYCALVTLTPEIARRLLAPEIAHSNRDRSPTKVASFADDMKAGMWSPNCSMISMAGTVLADGQTRDEAVVVSDTEQDFVLVVRPANDPGVFDQQHKRKFTEAEAMRASHIDGIPRNQRGPIATAILIHRLWAGVSYDRFRTASDQLKHNHFHTDEDETVRLYEARTAFYAEAHQPLPVECVAGMAACLEYDREHAGAFLECFASAARQPVGHPAHKLFHWLQQPLRGRTGVHEFYNAAICCCEAFVRDRDIRTISVSKTTFERPRWGK